MIKIDYKLERDDGGKNPKIYKPALFKNNELHELSEIEADNSWGKSTFLQIMAMSFYACKDTVENDELLSKINQALKNNTNSTDSNGKLKIANIKIQNF